ncbi:hypothetical protein [Minwuia thermotolerans]|uniref:Uncharacterized protein n=1 Tax=Minwuia thermotolerans TaxID=2056226 RepID=A0A2M9FZT5_9PROT|nr:hypothetical protein [Minwuia thermotolerans]PJK28949.1 hypothetical protein CVT23_13570 [Minwuia thermotolerans]
MLDWLQANSTVIQLVFTAAMVAVWVLYLQIFLTSIRRQKRPNIVISCGAGSGMDARILVSNLGFEPIFIVDVIMTVWTSEQEHRTVVTDRSELSPEQLARPTEATNQGPLKTGEYTDMGSFREFVERVRQSDHVDLDGKVEGMDIKVIGTTAAQSRLIAAEREFALTGEGRDERLRPTRVVTTQVRSGRGRRRLRRELHERLQPPSS